MGLNFGVNGALTTHIVPHGTDLGFTATDAAFALSVIAGLAALGKPVFGRIADLIDKRAAFGIAAGLQIAGLTLLTTSETYSSVFLAGGLFGFGMGGLIPIWGSVVGAAFGRLAFGQVTGLTILWMLPIQIIPNPLAGYLFDRFGSYDFAFYAMLGNIAASMLVFLLLRLPEVEPGR
jgi:MFS family permease